jgi:ADP-ribose pyrophosphatase YjhB (NUDIX family)
MVLLQAKNVQVMGRFNIRVYGILMDSNRRVLVSDEYIKGHFFTKFPGGGLEFGEGTRDCLRREFKEETGLDVEIGDHLYTTDFFQISAFNNNDQIISIYYLVHGDATQLETKINRFDFIPHQISDPEGEAEVFRWIEWNDLSDELMDLPIDKLVVKMIKEKY